MKQKITYKDALLMIQGSSIYSTGGGYAYVGQKKMFGNLFRKIKSIDLISIDELSDDDFVCTAYAVGSAGNTEIDLSSALKKGLQILQEYSGKKVKAIFAGETNIDIIAAQSAAALNLPILDADSNGGRAVPEIQMDNFVIANEPITPVVAVTLEDEVAILSETKDSYYIETFVRTLAGNSKIGMVATLDHLIQVKKAKKILTHGIFARSLALGELIEKEKNSPDILEKIIREIGGQLLIEGEIVENSLVSNKEQGFLNGEYVVKNKRGDEVKVFAKNENIIAWKNGRVFVTSPDRVMTIDMSTLLGIHNSKIKKGQHVVVVAARAEPLWRGKKGIELFAPKHFGFDFKPKLLKT